MTDAVASRNPSRLPYWLFALFLAAVAGVTGLWFLGAKLVREQIATTGRAVAGEGGVFTVQTLAITGFPFRFDATLGGVTLSGHTARGPWEWRGERAVLHFNPWRGTDAAFELPGLQRLRFHAARRAFDLEITARHAPGAIHPGTGDSPGTVRLAADGVELRDIASGSRLAAERLTLELRRYAAEGRKNRDPAAGLIVDLAGVDLPPGADRFLGPKLARLVTELQVTSELPLPMSRQSLARWREKSGTLELKTFSAEWGAAKVTGSGTVTLDAALQPEAAFSARMSGFEEAIDALVAAGFVQAREAQGVKLVLSLMARRSEPGRGAEISAPITIQDRTVYVGPARLTRMPLIRW